jgi:hypothetical protein
VAVGWADINPARGIVLGQGACCAGVGHGTPIDAVRGGADSFVTNRIGNARP